MNRFEEYKKCAIKSGDMVQVITGKEKGKKGKIKDFDRKTGRVTIEGLNMRTHFKKGSGIITKEGGIHVSNVMLWDESINKVTRYKVKIETENDKIKKTRISVKSGNVI